MKERERGGRKDGKKEGRKGGFLTQKVTYYTQFSATSFYHLTIYTPKYTIYNPFNPFCRDLPNCFAQVHSNPLCRYIAVYITVGFWC